MIKKLNLRLYFLLIGLFLIFNLSCEDEDITTLLDADLSTSEYRIELTSKVCDANKNPDCDETYIDYNDNMLVDKTIIEGTITGDRVLDGEVLESFPVNGNVICTIHYPDGTDLTNQNNPTLDDINDTQLSGVAIAVDGKFILQFNDRGNIGTFTVDCYYQADNLNWTSDAVAVETRSIYERIREITIENYEDQEDLDELEPNLDFGLNQDNVGPEQPNTVTVKIQDENGHGIPGIEVHIDNSEYSYVISDVATTSSEEETIGEAIFTININETSFELQDTLSVITNNNQPINEISLDIPVYIENENLNCENLELCDNNILTTDSSSNNIQIYINQAITEEQALSSVSNVAFLNFNSSFLELSDAGDASLMIETYATNIIGEALDGIEIELSLTSSDASTTIVFENSKKQITAIDPNEGGATFPIAIHNVLISSTNPSKLIDLEITATVNKENEVESADPIIINAGNLFAKNLSRITSFELSLDESLDLDEGNTTTMQVTIKDSDGAALEGIHVDFRNASEYGTLEFSEAESGEDGIIECGLSNIETPNASILETIFITAEIIDPQDDTTVLYSQTETLFAGNKFALHGEGVVSVELSFSSNPLTLDGTSNSVTVEAIVSDANGIAVEGFPINFKTNSDYGTFITNNVESGTDGIAENTLQNIELPNSSILEAIGITAEIIDPEDGSILYMATENLYVGDLFAKYQ